MAERTFIAIKPDGVKRNLIGKIVTRFEEKGYKIGLWSIDTHDWERKSAKEIENTIINNTKGGDIILFHDYTSGENHTVEALDKIIPILKEKGLEFVTVSQLLQK